MLHPLPFRTFGELAPLGLVAAVYCSRCYETRRIDDERVCDRCFATARFRCTKIRYTTGEVCGCPGQLQIRPASPLPIGGPDAVAFLWCKRCPWEINQVPIDQLLWSVPNWRGNIRFRCPSCGARVEWHIHGPTWRPTYGAPVIHETHR